MQQAVALGDDEFALGAHDAQIRWRQRRARELGRRVRDVVGGLEGVEEAGDGRGGEGGAEADAGEAEGFGERLHDDQVRPLEYPFRERGARGREVDVGFVQHDHPVPGRVLQDRFQ